jgi:hypothetical protein
MGSISYDRPASSAPFDSDPGLVPMHGIRVGTKGVPTLRSYPLVLHKLVDALTLIHPTFKYFRRVDKPVGASTFFQSRYEPSLEKKRRNGVAAKDGVRVNRQSPGHIRVHGLCYQAYVGANSCPGSSAGASPFQ